MKKIKLLSVLTLMFLTCILYGQSIQVLDDVSGSKIDWTNGKYVAVGMGAVPSREEMPNRAIALLKAKDYAKMEAIANLLMLIDGTQIDYDATGEDYMSDTVIKQKIKGYVSNVSVEEAKKVTVEGDEVVIVKCISYMYGLKNPNTVNSALNPGSVLLEKSIKKDQDIFDSFDIKDVPQPKGRKTTDAPVIVAPASKFPVTINPQKDNLEKWLDKPAPYQVAKRSASGEKYTGVIFDASGFALDRSMSPKIRLDSGDVVWAGANASPETVIAKGVCVYAESVEAAKKNPRAGKNPLVVSVINITGAGKFKTDLIITGVDAEILKDENVKGKFLDDLNVVIVKNPMKPSRT